MEQWHPHNLPHNLAHWPPSEQRRCEQRQWQLPWLHHHQAFHQPQPRSMRATLWQHTQPLRDAPTALRLLKSMLGLGRLLRRTVVLPATLCTCVFGAAAAKLLQVSECASGVAATPRDIPFGCPLRPEVRSALALEHWVQGSSLPRTPLHLELPLAPVSLLAASALPRDLARSHVRVLLPDGMSDSETRYALRSYGDTRILELERTAEAYCGWDPRHDQSGEGAQFEELVRPLFAASTPTLHICEHFHGGAGEVQRFTNLGTLGDTHAVSAPFERCPRACVTCPTAPTW